MKKAQKSFCHHSLNRTQKVSFLFFFFSISTYYTKEIILIDRNGISWLCMTNERLRGSDTTQTLQLTAIKEGVRFYNIDNFFDNVIIPKK